jgi:sigma-54 dependent transcriptional regulator, acetoin dehydrogenase operon transcriptional activator AcoR
MAAPPKRLFILSLDPKVNKFLCNTIHNIIGCEVAVCGSSLAEADSCFSGADLVLTSVSALLPEARKRFPQCPVMAPRRIIAGYNLEKVLLLPKATPVLVVNHPREATEETIASLKRLGLDHVRYIPYWQGSELPQSVHQARTAVSPGMGHIVPAHIETLIDIGPRLISLASFARLLMALDLDLGYLEHYADQYHNFLLASSRKLADALGYAELMGKRNEVILDEFEEGVVSVNAQGRIDRVNRSAFDLLHLSSGDILNRRMDRIFQALEKVADLIEPADHNSKSAGIYACRDKQLIVTKIPVESGRQRSHLYTLREIARMQSLEKDVRIKLARRGYLSKYCFDDIQGSAALQAAIAKARRFARTEKNILITGESGTGKELFAHAIHHASLRANGPFVAVNFAGLPESLIESELFGFEEGAFTGARRGGKAGLFEQAHGGTLFLDEIGDASPAVQSRLLRVVQEREVLRVGGSRITPVDVRIIAATNTDLQHAMAKRLFREDLYFRLNTLPLEIPPLRERSADIADFFNSYIQKHYHICKPLEPEAAERLTAYSWPGNLRELINAAEYALIASEGNPRISPAHLPPALLRQGTTPAPAPASPENPGSVTPAELTVEYSELRGRLCGGPLTAEALRMILATLCGAGPVGIGRNGLRCRLREGRLELSEGYMKSALKRLRREGLVSVGMTRQGTVLTPRGESFLGFLTMHPGRED